MQWQDYQKRRGIGDYRASFNVNPESKKIRELDITGLKSIPHVTSVRAFHIRSDITVSYTHLIMNSFHLHQIKNRFFA